MKLLVFFLPLALLACKTYSDDDKANFEAEIKSYIKENNIEGLSRSGSGLYYKIEQQGADRTIQYKDRVHFKYVGKLTNGKEFDNQLAEGQTFYVQELIPAWKEIMFELGEGGKAYIISPPHLGYGDHELEKIPQHSILIYEIEIVEVM